MSEVRITEPDVPPCERWRGCDVSEVRIHRAKGSDQLECGCRMEQAEKQVRVIVEEEWEGEDEIYCYVRN